MRFPEDYRLRRGHGVPFGRESEPGDPYGCFLVRANLAARRPLALRCLATSGLNWADAEMVGVVEIGSLPWEHVSVSLQPPGMIRCPTWEEMCHVKSLFWEPEQAVVQIHPPESEYVNESRFCLHLWRPVGIELPRPPSICVGMKPGER